MTAQEIIYQTGLGQNSKGLFTDMEDIVFNMKTKELFYHDCTNGELTLYRKVKDLEDLKQALWDGFKWGIANKL